MGWDDNGLPTERRVQNYYGVRCDPSQPYDPSYEPPADAGDLKKGTPQVSISRRNFVELCHALTAEDEKAFEELFKPPRPVGRLDADLRDDRRPRPARRPAGVPAQPRPRRGVRDRGADALGRRLQDRRRAGRARRPRAAGRLPPDRLRAAPDGEPVFIETTRPELHPGLRRAGRPPRRRALPAAVRHDRDDAAVRRRGAGARPRARRPDQGLRHRDDLHLRRHHRRHLVARARPAGAQHRRPRRPHRHDAAGRRGAPSRTPSWPARRSSRRRSASSSCSPSPATWSASPRRSPTR